MPKRKWKRKIDEENGCEGNGKQDDRGRSRRSFSADDCFLRAREGLGRGEGRKRRATDWDESSDSSRIRSQERRTRMD